MEKDQPRSDRGQIIHDFADSSKPKISSISLKQPELILFLILAIMGVGTGFVASQISRGGSVSVVPPGGKIQTSSIGKGQVFGSTDEKTFNNTTEGVLREGGVDGEGSFHLERPGGVSQNVYLTSTVLDLSSFVGKKIKVWGKTYEAEKAGWLMDVGKVQIL